MRGLAWPIITTLREKRDELSLLDVQRERYVLQTTYFSHYLPVFGKKILGCPPHNNIQLEGNSFHHAATKQLCILAGEKVCGSSSKRSRINGRTAKISIHHLRTNIFGVAHFKA